MVNNIFKQLKAPFHPKDVKSRKAFGGKAKILHYIDARNVMERLDEVLGEENWQSKVASYDGKTICELSIRVDDEWITKTDGAGDTGIEADKGAISDAFKRAAVLFGVGRYLYEGRDPEVVWDEYNEVATEPEKATKGKAKPKLEAVEEVDFVTQIKKKKTVKALEDFRVKNREDILASPSADTIKEAYKQRLMEVNNG